MATALHLSSAPLVVATGGKTVSSSDPAGSLSSLSTSERRRKPTHLSKAKQSRSFRNATPSSSSSFAAPVRT